MRVLGKFRIIVLILLLYFSLTLSPLIVEPASASCLRTTRYVYKTDIYNFEGVLLETYDKGTVEECLDTNHVIPALVSKEGNIVVKSEVLEKGNDKYIQLSNENGLQVVEFNLSTDHQYQSFIDEQITEYWDVYGYQFSSQQVEWSSVTIDDFSTYISFHLTHYIDTVNEPVEAGYTLENISKIFKDEITRELNLTDPVDTMQGFFENQQLVSYGYFSDNLYLLADYTYKYAGNIGNHIPFIYWVNLADYSSNFTRISSFEQVSHGERLIYADQDRVVITSIDRNDEKIIIIYLDANKLEIDSEIIRDYEFAGHGYGSYVVVTNEIAETSGIFDLISGDYWPLSSHILYIGFPGDGNHIIGSDIILVDYYTSLPNRFGVQLEFLSVIYGLIVIGFITKFVYPFKQE